MSITAPQTLRKDLSHWQQVHKKALTLGTGEDIDEAYGMIMHIRQQLEEWER